MSSPKINRYLLLFVLMFALLSAGVATRTLFAQNQNRAEQKSNFSGRLPAASPTPTPTPRTREELPQDSDEVVKVETNLTNIFFTAADKNKRFIGGLKAEDIRILEDGKPQEIFTFQQNIDLPLSIAILIDTSISEERTLPDEKSAAQAFLESVIRAQK